jgi:hypothetical protein
MKGSERRPICDLGKLKEEKLLAVANSPSKPLGLAFHDLQNL